MLETEMVKGAHASAPPSKFFVFGVRKLACAFKSWSKLHKL